MKPSLLPKPVALAVALALLTANVPPALAFPPLPSSFYGTVKVDGTNVPLGTTVSAWINGVQYAQYILTSLYDGDTIYSLDIPGDDPQTPEKEGGLPGETIVFYIGDQRADQTAIWQSGRNLPLNLSYTTADLSIGQADWPDPAGVGDLLTYTLTITNSGPAMATGMTLTDTLPMDVTFASASTGCGYDSSAHAVICNVNSLAKDAIAAATVAVTVTASAARTISNTARVAGSQYDPDIANNIASVQTLVNHPPVANDQSATTDEDTPLSITLTATDVDGDLLTYSVMTSPTHGSLSGSAPNLIYMPGPDYNGSDSFTFRASDGMVSSNIVAVSITVNPVNDPPMAVDDAYGTNRGHALTVVAPGVLNNDTDIDGDTLAATLISDPVHGVLTFHSDGSFIYTPATNYVGADWFTYRASDGVSSSNVATVTLAVHWENSAPVAANDAYTVDEDQVLSIAIPGVLGNDADADGDALTSEMVSGPTHGVFVLNLGGSFVYTPTAEYNGTDSFIYRASDGVVTSNLAAVIITVNPVPDPPDSVDVQVVPSTLVVNSGATAGVTATVKDAFGDPVTGVTLSGNILPSVLGNVTMLDVTNANGQAFGTWTAGSVAGIGLLSVGNGSLTGTTGITLNNPAAVITSLSPTTMTVGSPAFTLLVTGTNFVQGASVFWNGSARATMFVNSGRLDAAILTSDITATGQFGVAVVNPSPGGGTSNTLFFAVVIRPATVGDFRLYLPLAANNYVATSDL